MSTVKDSCLVGHSLPSQASVAPFDRDSPARKRRYSAAFVTVASRHKYVALQVANLVWSASCQATEMGLATLQ